MCKPLNFSDFGKMKTGIIYRIISINNNIDEIMLSQIPGVSSAIAIVIMNKFETLQNLLNKLNEDSTCLQNLTYTNSKNQIRKLNKTSTENIVKFLLKK